jgi:hypothetical protein
MAQFTKEEVSRKGAKTQTKGAKEIQIPLRLCVVLCAFA